MISAKRKPNASAEVAKHVTRIVTATARVCFWLLCYHFYGTEALLFLAAAWTFLLAVKDLTSARVRLRNMADPLKRRTAAVKSVAFEVVLLAARLALIALLGRLLLPFSATVAALVTGLMLCAVFWAKETLLTLARVRGVGTWLRYPALLSALCGLALIAWYAERGLAPVEAATTALIQREAITFAGFAFVVLLGLLRGPRVASDEDDEDEEDGAGKALSAIGPDGREIRSTFKVFIADNVVYSGWRIVQFGTRALANGLLGPLGSIASRIFFIYRKPGAFVAGRARPSRARIAALSAILLALAAVVAVVAQRSGLLHAVGIVAAAFVLRIGALVLNLLLWRHFRPLIAMPGRIRPIDLMFPRRSARRSEANAPPAGPTP